MNNFKNLSLLFCFALCSFQLNAQTRIGGKVGINLASYSFSDEFSGVNTNPLIGVVFGGAVEIGISNLLSIQPEVLFYQKGSIIEIDLAIFQESTQILNYLELPVLIKANFGAEGSTRFFVNAGPSVGYAMSATVDDGSGKEDIDFENSDFERMDFSVAIGGGVAIPAGPGSFFIDLRYLLGLTDLNGSEILGEQMNRGVNINLGYMLAIGE